MAVGGGGGGGAVRCTVSVVGAHRLLRCLIAPRDHRTLINCVCDDLNSVENCDRILDCSTGALEDTRFVKLFGRYLGLYY